MHRQNSNYLTTHRTLNHPLQQQAKGAFKYYASMFPPSRISEKAKPLTRPPLECLGYTWMKMSFIIYYDLDLNQTSKKQIHCPSLIYQTTKLYMTAFSQPQHFFAVGCVLPILVQSIQSHTIRYNFCWSLKFRFWHNRICKIQIYNSNTKLFINWRFMLIYICPQRWVKI